MVQENNHRIPKLDYVLILFTMALAFYVAFIPHQSYPYPVHIDEWVHMAYSKAIIQAGSTTFIDPFYGELVIGLTGSESDFGAGLEHEEKWEGEVSFVPEVAGANQKVEFLLFKEGESEPYSRLYLWLDVKETG